MQFNIILYSYVQGKEIFFLNLIAFFCVWCVCVCVFPPLFQVFLPSSLCVSYGQWMEEKKRTNGTGWLF